MKLSPYPIRRSQAINPFGIGAMVDFPGPVSLIHAGLDAWPFKESDEHCDEFKIEDEHRLARRLNVRYFVQPPDYRFAASGQRFSQPNLNLRLPFLRFPKWHVCPRCGMMHESAYHDRSAPECEGPVATGKDKGRLHKPRKTIQVRFIAACPNGHIQDFPWWEWVFKDPFPEKQGRLRMKTTGSASLAGVRIVCEDEDIHQIKSRTLSGAFSYEPGQPSALSRLEIYCRGENPVLAIPGTSDNFNICGSHLYPLLRGSSNVYFPQIISSIFLPPTDSLSNDDVLEVLENYRVWSFLQMSSRASDDGRVDSKLAQAVLEKYFPNLEIRPQDLADAANRKLEQNESESSVSVSQATEEIDYRREEYDLFCRDVHEGYPKTNLLVRAQNTCDYSKIVTDHFSRISLVHKLRETRVFVGFTRIFPENDQTAQQRRELISREAKEWLPAVIVRGEGIFLNLSESSLLRWLNQYGGHLNRRISVMQSALDGVPSRRRQSLLPISPRFVLLHTISHLLINQLVFDCGYGSASLRERIYSSDDESQPMAGILIFTAAGDSEGTLGGLVRMGQAGRLEGVIHRALDKARWCSSDPVCMESNGQGPDSCNLAACHSCALLPETSCEEQNRFLDRGLVVGTLSEESIGFFSHMNE